MPRQEDLAGYRVVWCRRHLQVHMSEYVIYTIEHQEATQMLFNSASLKLHSLTQIT